MNFIYMCIYVYSPLSPTSLSQFFLLTPGKNGANRHTELLNELASLFH